MKRVLIALFLASLLFAFSADAQEGVVIRNTPTVAVDGTINTVKIDGTTNTVKTSGAESSVALYGTANVVQACTYATWSQSDAVASTNAVAISDLTGRDYLEIRSGQTAGEEIWVGIGVTPTVGAGICVTAASPFKGAVPAGVVVKTIASGAFAMSVTQAAY